MKALLENMLTTYIALVFTVTVIAAPLFLIGHISAMGEQADYSYNGVHCHKYGEPKLHGWNHSACKWHYIRGASYVTKVVTKERQDLF